MKDGGDVHLDELSGRIRWSYALQNESVIFILHTSSTQWYNLVSRCKMGRYATTNILQTKNKVFRINDLQRQND